MLFLGPVTLDHLGEPIGSVPKCHWCIDTNGH